MTPDPEFFFESKAHGEILNRLEITLRLNRGLSVIMGGIGTGKTTLSRLLLSRFVDFGKNFQFYLIMDPTWENTREFLVYLKRLFGLRGSSLYQSEMLNQLENFLIDSAVKQNKQIVLIIDEGQKMRRKKQHLQLRFSSRQRLNLKKNPNLYRQLKRKLNLRKNLNLYRKLKKKLNLKNRYRLQLPPKHQSKPSPALKTKRKKTLRLRRSRPSWVNWPISVLVRRRRHLILLHLRQRMHQRRRKNLTPLPPRTQLNQIFPSRV